MPRKPYETDDEEEPPPRPRRKRNDYDDDFDGTAPVRYAMLLPIELFTVGKILLLIGASLLALAAFGASAIQAAALAGLACVAGIAARICQAEEQFCVTEKRLREAERTEKKDRHPKK